jgi:hypothetical protein
MEEGGEGEWLSSRIKSHRSDDGFPLISFFALTRIITRFVFHMNASDSSDESEASNVSELWALARTYRGVNEDEKAWESRDLKRKKVVYIPIYSALGGSRKVEKTKRKLLDLDPLFELFLCHLARRFHYVTQTMNLPSRIRVHAYP